MLFDGKVLLYMYIISIIMMHFNIIFLFNIHIKNVIVCFDFKLRREDTHYYLSG